MTSALIFPRSRKIGRIVPNARFRTRPKPTRNVNARSVIVVEICEQHDERDRRRQEAAGELDEARADEVPHALDVAT